MSSSAPVWTFVVVDARPFAHEAEENVSRRPHNDADVPVPHDEVVGLWLGYVPKSFDFGIQIVGACIGVRESGAFVDGVYEMRTVVSGVAADLRVKCGCDYREAIVHV